MATPKQIYIPQIDSTIEVPEGMDEETAKQEALSSYQETFPDDYQLKQKAIEEFKKQLLDPIDYGDEDQPANSAPVETPNTNKATEQKGTLPFENIANLNIAKYAFGLPNILGTSLGQKISDLVGLDKNEEVFQDLKKDTDAFYKGAESGLTANLTNPVKAGVATILESLLPFRAPKSGAIDTYKGYRGSQKKEQEKVLKESPISNILGQITGAVMPISAGAQLFTKGGKAISSLTAGGKLEKTLPSIKKIIDSILTGGGTNLAYQAVDPETDIKNPLKTFLTGAAFNFVPTAVGESLKKSWNSGLIQDKAIPALKSGFKDNPLTGWIGSMVDAIKKGKFQNTMGKLNTESRLDDKQGIVKQLLNTVDDVKAGITTPYKELKGSLFQKFGESKGDTIQLKTAIGDLFKKEGLLSAEGKVDLSKLSQFKITSDKLKQYKELAQLYEGLNKGDMSLNTVKTILESIGDKAKFKALDRGSFEKQLGSLYNSTRGSIDDTLGNLAGGKTKEVFQNLRKNVSEVKDVFGKRNVGLDKILRKEPEKIIDSIKTNLSPNYVKDVVTKYPKLKEPVEKVLLSHFFNKATDPKSLARLMKNYGAKELQSLLSKENFNLLQKVTGNKALFDQVKKSSLWQKVKPTLKTANMYGAKTLDSLTQ